MPDVKAVATSNWPQWRGPEGQGISTEKNLPYEWSDTKNVTWKTPIPGRGFSSPIIWGNRIFLTTAIEGGPAPADHKLSITKLPGRSSAIRNGPAVTSFTLLRCSAFDRDNGKILWNKTAYEGTVFDHRHKRGAYAAPTAATDGSLVFVWFGSEGFYCYDFKGNLVWKKALGGVPTMGMGVGTSPVLYENLVIVQCDQGFDGAKSFITALDKKTGNEVWRTPRPVHTSWTTPIIVTTKERTELITSGAEFLISYDPKTGKEYWRAGGLQSHAIATPVVGQGMVVLSSGYPQKAITAVRLGGSGVVDGTDKVAWKYNKGTSYVPSPIVYGDYIYLMNDAGVMTCLKLATGELVYEGGRVPIATKFYGASPVAFDGKILLTSDDGDTFVIKAGPTHEVLATNSLGEPVRSSIAISNGKLFIRGEKNLYCVGN